MSKLLALLFTLCIGTGALSQVLILDAARTVRIAGEINGSKLAVAGQIEKLADRSKKPIYLVINSQGGSVAIGMQILSSMYMAKSRGHKIVCVVPVVAASMGFQILAECDSRYALKYSLLLWHPMAQSFFMATLNGEDMLYNSQRIRAWEQPLLNKLLQVLRINKRFFYYHWRNQTLWTADEVKKFSPRFIRIVEDIKNLPDPFSL